MKLITISILIMFSLSGEDGVLNQARNAYVAGDYVESIRLYREALRTYPERSSQIRFNLAQCYARVDSVSEAMLNYEQATRSADADLASRAWNNIGEIKARGSDLEAAKESFMRALTRYPDNEKARFNYELAVRRMQNDRQEKPEENNPEQQNPLPPPPDPIPNIPDYLTEARQLFGPPQPIPGDEARSLDTISLSMARRQLEAMRREDKQFVQQLTRRFRPPSGTKSGERPSW